MKAKILDMRKYKSEYHFNEAIERWEDKGWVVAVQVNNYALLYLEITVRESGQAYG